MISLTYRVVAKKICECSKRVPRRATTEFTAADLPLAEMPAACAHREQWLDVESPD